MELKPENKLELLKAFRTIMPGCDEMYETDRFLSFLRSQNTEFESYDSEAKGNIFYQYMKNYVGKDQKTFRMGRDG